MSLARSALSAPAQPLWGYVLLSVLGHGAAAAGFTVFSLLASLFQDDRPIIDPNKTMEVSMVVLPRANKSLPDKASQIQVRTGEQPTAKPPPEPPPVKTSDLEFKKESAPPDPGVDVQRKNQDREKLLADLKRKQLLQELMDAPAGNQDRQATDPNSTSDEALHALGTGAVGDPEFAKYKAKVQQLFMQHFKPLGSLTAKNPKIECTVLLRVDATSGKILSYEVQRPSGEPSYDAAATRAVEAVGTLPLPPAKYLPLVTAGYQVRFTPP